MVQALKITSAQGDYTVDFPSGLEAVVEKLEPVTRPLLLIDRKVAGLYRRELGSALSRIPTLELDATEEEKTLVGVAKVTTWLQDLGCTKQNMLLAVGGGIIQDIATFSAHVYYRGLRWIYVPTTLLSMSDSCIGAKAGINLGSFKNQLGVFHSPSYVIVCPKFIETLSDADVASGYGEILKLMLTGPEDHFNRFRTAVEKDGLRGPDLARLIRQSLEVKKVVIEQDEYERDLRLILNYGHTFGHALESLTQHEVPHGLAVAWGLDLINFISWKRGLLRDEALFRSVHQFIRGHLPFKLKRRIEAARLIDCSRRDKKVSDGQLTLVLMEKPGTLKVVKTPFDHALEAQVTEYIETHNAFDSD